MRGRRSLAEQARDKLLGLAVLVKRAPTIHRMSEAELEAFAALVKAAASALNAAHCRLIRLVRKQKKIGAAGALHETRK
jgi:hypothetical protein